MDETILDKIEYYVGDIKLGDFVVYARNGDFSSLGEYKKDIWEVVDEGYLDDVKIKNIAKKGTEFATNITNLLSVKNLQGIVNNWENFFSQRSLAKYESIKRIPDLNTHVFDTSRYTVWDPGETEAIYNNTISIEARDGIETEIKQYGETEMNMMNRVINTNVSAAKAGAKISAGTTLNRVVKKTVRDRVPRKYRKLVDSPAGDILVANVASFAVQNFAKSNTKALVAADAMMQAAMVEFMNSFNLDELITDVLSQVNIDELMPAE